MVDNDEVEKSNYATFRDCISEPVIRKLAVVPTAKSTRRRAKSRKSAVTGAGAGLTTTTTTTTTTGGISNEEEEKSNGKTTVKEPNEEETSNDAEDLGEFIDYLASEIFPNLPTDFRTLTHALYQSSPTLQSTYADPLPPRTLDRLIAALPSSIADSLSAYGVTSSASTNTIDESDYSSLVSFFLPIFSTYRDAATAPPPVWSSTRASACEICERDWIPLTYHHLIPKAVHDKVRRRGWHPEDRLNSVAWLCRSCHSQVHRVASNEELARHWFTVERLREREDIRRWAEWVARVRWKAR